MWRKYTLVLLFPDWSRRWHDFPSQSQSKTKAIDNSKFYMILQQWCSIRSSSLCNAYRNILAIIRINFYDFRQDPVWVIRAVSVHKTSLFPLAYCKQTWPPVWKGYLFLLVLYHWAFTWVSLVGGSFFLLYAEIGEIGIFVFFFVVSFFIGWRYMGNLPNRFFFLYTAVDSWFAD